MDKLSLRAFAVILVSFVLFAPPFAAGQTATWTGQDPNDPGDWNDANNWNPPTVPNGASYNVVIPPTPPFPPPTLTTAVQIGNLSISTNQGISGQLNISTGGALTVSGSHIYNDGALNLFGTLNIAGFTVTLSGSGYIAMGASSATINGGGTLLNQQSISGIGQMLVSTLQNEGQIEAAGGTLYLRSKTVMNSSSLMGVAGTLLIQNATVENTGGTITSGSLSSCTIEEGTIAGTTLVTPGSFSTINGVTITGTYDVTAGELDFTGTNLKGIITNNGIITVNAFNGFQQKAELVVDSGVTLTGSGSVSLSGPQAYLSGTGALTLTGQQTISTSLDANITINEFINQSTVSGTVTIQVPGFDNTGGTLSGAITFSDTQLTGGQLIAAPTFTCASQTEVENVAISGSGNGATFSVPSCLLDNVSNSTTIQVPPNGMCTLEGKINNSGEIDMEGTPAAPALCVVDGTVELEGSGTITSNANNGNTIEGGLLDDIENAIKDPVTVSSNFELGPQATLAPQYSGTVTQFTGTTTVQGTVAPIDANVVFSSLANYANGTLTKGSFSPQGGGTIVLPGDVTTNAANINLNGGEIQDPNSNNALSSCSQNSGSFSISQGATLNSLAETFTNSKTFYLAPNSQFTGIQNFESNSGTTTVNGTITTSPPRNKRKRESTAGSIDITGGTLQGDGGTLGGDVTVGNASGATATFIIGGSIKQAGSMTVTNDYTQLPTGVMDVQLGGLEAGTQYSQLNITGTATLDGTLNINPLVRTIPPLGTKFTIINASTGVSGAFATVNGAGINSSEHFEVVYNPASVELEVVSGELSERGPMRK